jgi:hypothetical protein
MMPAMTTYNLILPNQIEAAGSLIGSVSEYFCKLFNLYQCYAVYEGISLVLVQQCNAPDAILYIFSSQDRSASTPGVWLCSRYCDNC